MIGDPITCKRRANFDHAADEVRTSEEAFAIWSTGGPSVTDKIRGVFRNLMFRLVPCTPEAQACKNKVCTRRAQGKHTVGLETDGTDQDLRLGPLPPSRFTHGYPSNTGFACVRFADVSQQQTVGGALCDRPQICLSSKRDEPVCESTSRYGASLPFP